MTALNPARSELLRMFGLDTPIVRGTGHRLFDAQGREYLDFLAQYGALPFGQNPPEIWEGLNAAQDDQLPSLLQPLHCAEAERLAQRLAAVTPGDLSITTLTNSGAETVEAAIKLARLRTGRSGILSTKNGFHGKTLGALSATGKPQYQAGFAAPAPGFDYVPFGDLDALRAHLAQSAHTLAAFIVEPIQGEGGVICPPEGYIDGAIRLCREADVLFILDEIQTGLGRTGTLFACSDGAEVPDMLLLAKALGGGLMPIGACIVRPSAWDDDFGRRHSSTFANNGLACRAANVTLDLLLADDGALIRRVAENGRELERQLEALRETYPDVIREVRGEGYMRGVEFHRFDMRDDSATMAFASLNGGVTPLVSSHMMNIGGVLTAPLFNETHVLRLQPPLTAGLREIDRAIGALETVCRILSDGDTCALVRHLVAGRVITFDAPPPRDDDAGPTRAPAVAAQTAPDQFGFLIHYTEEADIVRSDPSFANFDGDELAAWCDWVKQFGPGYVRRIPEVTSKTGATSQGWILSVPMLPADMRGRGKAAAVEMIRRAVDIAVGDGVSRVGLGAYTSIVTRGGEGATGRGADITSGNSLSAISAVQSVEAVAARTGLDLATAHVVVVGASGAIGRLASLMLARRAGTLTLVGNAGNPFSSSFLSRVADEVYASLAAAPLPAQPGLLVRMVHDGQRRYGLPGDLPAKGLAERFATAFQTSGEAAPVVMTTDMKSALETADVVVFATSTELEIVNPCDLASGTLVCDVARPPNVAHVDASGNGVLVFDGGLIHPPSPVDLGAFQVLPHDLCWGCLGETMLLSLARQSGNFSIGAQLSLADADLLAGLADVHGFVPATPQWRGERITDDAMQEFAWHVATRGAGTRTSTGSAAHHA